MKLTFSEKCNLMSYKDKLMRGYTLTDKEEKNLNDLIETYDVDKRKDKIAAIFELLY
jgi:hypothetical protein